MTTIQKIKSYIPNQRSYSFSITKPSQIVTVGYKHAELHSITSFRKAPSRGTHMPFTISDSTFHNFMQSHKNHSTNHLASLSSPAVSNTIHIQSEERQRQRNPHAATRLRPLSHTTSRSIPESRMHPKCSRLGTGGRLHLVHTHTVHTHTTPAV